MKVSVSGRMVQVLTPGQLLDILVIWLRATVNNDHARHDQVLIRSVELPSSCPKSCSYKTRSYHEIQECNPPVKPAFLVLKASTFP